MEDITQRFIEFYNFLLENQIVRSASDFARSIGVSASLMTELSKGRTNLGTKAIQNTVSLYGLDTNWLFTGSGNMLKSQKSANYKAPAPINKVEEEASLYIEKNNYIPLVDINVVAGFGKSDFSIQKHNIQALYKVPDFIGVDFMIHVKGDSMYPKYGSGDIVACRILKDSKFIEWNKPHLIATLSHGLIIKRLHPSEQKDCLKAVSENTIYAPFDIPKNEITGIAVVLGSIRFE